jgi:DNA polymerase II large subunit
MDAPVFISIFMHPEEVDTQVHNMDVTRFYPRDFYLETLNKADPKNVRKFIICIEDLLGSPLSFYKFSSFGYPGLLSLKKNVSTYSSIKSMEGKLELQLKLIDKIFDERVKKKIISYLIDHHIVRDISGNIKSFATQTFRCKKCNHIHRRLPLDGKCEICGGELIQTVSLKSVVKYLPYAKKLTQLIDDPYLKSVVSILEEDINNTFRSKEVSLTSLTELFAEEVEQDGNLE